MLYEVITVLASGKTGDLHTVWHIPTPVSNMLLGTFVRHCL